MKKLEINNPKTLTEYALHLISFGVKRCIISETYANGLISSEVNYFLSKTDRNVWSSFEETLVKEGEIPRFNSEGIAIQYSNLFPKKERVFVFVNPEDAKI
jgi:hypothetical protein